jgi:glycosyltransferase involved in cell wall biosynthesis
MLTIGCVTISYNQGKYLRECIESVNMADRTKLRHVIVDPGSTDNSREIIREYEKQGRFHEVVLEKDSGPADGLNKGFAKLGDVDIFCYLNSDDCFCKGALDRVSHYLSREDSVDVLLGGGLVIDEKSHAHIRARVSLPFNATAHLHDATFAFQPSTFIRKAKLESNPFNPENKSCWDTELLIDLLLSEAIFRNRSEAFGKFRFYSGSLTHNYISTGMSPQRVIDYQRISNKLRASGCVPMPYPIPGIHRLLNKYNPLRRLIEFYMGIKHRAGNI